MKHVETILYQQALSKFSFNDFSPFLDRYVVITKTALRVYETKKDALSTYGKPLIAIPLVAISSIERLMLNLNDDQRLQEEGVNAKVHILTKNIFEFNLRDEFLPIYTNLSYLRMFKDTSVAYDFSPRKYSKKSPSGMSQSRMQSGSLHTSIVSPRSSMQLDLHKRTAIEMKSSPSKNHKIQMKYISSYQDVGPIIQPKQVSYDDLQELAKSVDKKEFVKSDMRLIFALEDS